MSQTIPTYRLLGKTGLRVHPINLGTMTFGNKWTEGPLAMGETTQEDAIKIFRKYYDIGGNFIDTANFYQGGQSEEMVAIGLAKNNIPRGDMVIATKFTLPDSGREPNNRGNTKKAMFESVEKSLKRLNTHYIDVYYVHFWDFTTDAKEVMRNCDELIRSGKVLHVGISDAPSWVVAQCNTLADCYGWNPFACYQGRYSLDNREVEQDIIPMAQQFQMGFIPWGVLGGGKLTGTRTRENQEPESVKRSNVH
jgi:aryl-alcohol dehydrogenase-like predicted oxidoreductase